MPKTNNYAMKNMICLVCLEPKSAFQMDFAHSHQLPICKTCYGHRFRMTVIPISKLRVGQRFSWIPREWYGATVLTEKTLRICHLGGRKERVYDVKFDAAVVNPPGVCYGIPARELVRLLKPVRLLKRTK